MVEFFAVNKLEALKGCRGGCQARGDTVRSLLPEWSEQSGLRVYELICRKGELDVSGSSRGWSQTVNPSKVGLILAKKGPSGQ